jgi:hypothetical protein
MRRILLVTLLVGLMGALALPAAAGGNGAINDRANDCFFPVPVFEANGLRVQKVKTPSGQGQFHCHGFIDEIANAPDTAMVQMNAKCYLPAYFPQAGVGHAVIAPNGHINLTCNFSP